MIEKEDDPPLLRLLWFRVHFVGSQSMSDVCFNRRAELVSYILSAYRGVDRVGSDVCGDKE